VTPISDSNFQMSHWHSSPAEVEGDFNITCAAVDNGDEFATSADNFFYLKIGVIDY
jgi:hypothetical protein